MMFFSLFVFSGTSSNSILEISCMSLFLARSRIHPCRQGLFPDPLLTLGPLFLFDHPCAEIIPKRELLMAHFLMRCTPCCVSSLFDLTIFRRCFSILGPFMVRCVEFPIIYSPQRRRCLCYSRSRSPLLYLVVIGGFSLGRWTQSLTEG